MLFSEPKIPQYVDVFIYSPSVGTFQCSSASRKFLNVTAPTVVTPAPPGFSALQRAENSSIVDLLDAESPATRFSALQRAENSSIRAGVGILVVKRYVSVLFSEPKIPQSASSRCQHNPRCACFSALQRAENSSIQSRPMLLFSSPSFSALQRAENSSIRHVSVSEQQRVRFQCSSASRKFLNLYAVKRTASQLGR